MVRPRAAEHTGEVFCILHAPRTRPVATTARMEHSPLSDTWFSLGWVGLGWFGLGWFRLGVATTARMEHSPLSDTWFS